MIFRRDVVLTRCQARRVSGLDAGYVSRTFNENVCKEGAIITKAVFRNQHELTVDTRIESKEGRRRPGGGNAIVSLASGRTHCYRVDSVGRDDGESIPTTTNEQRRKVINQKRVCQPRSLFRGDETSSSVLGLRRRRISGEARVVE